MTRILSPIISYWHQNTPRYDEYESYCIHIPKNGVGSIIEIELVRCTNILLHEYANNANINALDQKDYFYVIFNSKIAEKCNIKSKTSTEMKFLSGN